VSESRHFFSTSAPHHTNSVPLTQWCDEKS